MLVTGEGPCLQRGRLAGEIGVVYGDILVTCFVQSADLGLVRLGYIGKVLLIIGIDVLGVGVARLIPQMMPFGRRKGQLGFSCEGGLAPVWNSWAWRRHATYF